MKIEQQKKLSYISKLMNLNYGVTVCSSLFGKGSALSADCMLHVSSMMVTSKLRQDLLDLKCPRVERPIVIYVVTGHPKHSVYFQSHTLKGSVY